MMPLKNEPDLFLSASLDSTVRIWSLDKFQQLYQLSFNSSASFNFVRVYDNGSKIITSKGSEVTVNSIHLILKNYLAVDSSIFELQPGFNTIENFKAHSIDFTISVASDNSAFIQKPDSEFKCTLYPPPSAQKIEVIKHSITLDRVIVMLSNCSICVYKCQKETALLEKIMQQSEIKDAEDKGVMV